jgi:peptidoglycan/LPS O-acetylase OafA/YrhL
MATLNGAVSDIVGSIRGVLGLSRKGRLREQLDHTLDLFAKAAEHDDLSIARKSLATAIEHQADALAQAVDPTKRRRLQWGPFFIALVLFDLPLAALTFWGWQYTEKWWGWAWTAACTFALIILSCATVYALVSTDED